MLRSLIALSVLLSAPTASAVDYVQCREMLRTKNELRTELTRVEGDFYSRASMHCMEKYRRGESSSEETDVCIKKAHDDAKSKTLGIPMALPGGWPEMDESARTVHTPEGKEIYKKAMKVAADMKKEGCPY